MTSDGQSMLGRVDDQRVVSVAGLFERGEYPADLFVHVGDQTVILRQLIANDFLRSRPSRQIFVTQHQTSIIEWMLRHEVRGKRRSLVVVVLTVFPWRLTWVVRRGEGDVGKERSRAVVRRQELDDGIGEQLGGELLAGAALRLGSRALTITDGTRPWTCN